MYVNIKKIFVLFLIVLAISFSFNFAEAFTVGGDNGIGNLDGFSFSIQNGNNVAPTINYTDENNVTSIIDSGDGVKGWENFYLKYRALINFLYALFIMTCLAGIIICALKLGSSTDNPQVRQQAISGLLFCGIGVALLGIAGLYFSLAMNIL